MTTADQSHPFSPLAGTGAGAADILPSASVACDDPLAAAVLLFAVGRWRGGQGSFADSLILIVVLQLILILPQLLQLVAIVLVPPLASIIGLASVALYFWLISHFGAELHGFGSALRVFFGVIATMVAVVFLLAFLMLPFVGAGV